MNAKKKAKKNYGIDKVCASGCDSLQLTKITNEEDNSYVERCDINSIYRFETKKENNHLQDTQHKQMKREKNEC